MNAKIDDDPVLTWAIAEERADLVSWLLDQGADPNVRDEHGHTPLQVAISGEDTGVALELMRRGADQGQPSMLSLSFREFSVSKSNP